MKRILDRLEETLACIVFMIMLALTFVNVVFRNFSASISFTEEITTSLFVLLCMLGTSIAARDHAHLGLSALTELMPQKTRKILAVGANVLGMVMSLILIVTGISMVKLQYDAKVISIALQWPQWIYGLFLPFGALLMLIRFSQAAMDDWKKYKEET